MGPANAADSANLNLQAARSDLLDAFGDLEVAITRILLSCEIASTNQPFGNRVQAFRNAERTSLIAKANFEQRDRLADDIASLLTVRADIVHSRMKPCILDGQTAALFINSQEACAKYPTGRVITLDQIKKVAAEAHMLAKQVSQLNRITPPSSPPPPSPDAAAGP